MPTHRGDGEPLRAEPGGRQYESHLYPSTRERRMRSRVGAPIATWEGRDRGRVWAVVRTAPCKGLPRRRRLALESAATGYRNLPLPRSGYLRLSLVPLSSSGKWILSLASSSLMRGLVGTRLGRPAARVLPSCWYPSRSRTSDVVWLLGPCVSPPAPPRSSSLVRSLRVPCSCGAAFEALLGLMMIIKTPTMHWWWCSASYKF